MLSSNIIRLFHHRWVPPILAELHRSRGSRFVALVHRLGVGRETLARTLGVLVEDDLVARNPGYGHPLRPEYVLTEAGFRVAPSCVELLQILERLDAADPGLKKWSMPVAAALAGEERRRFSDMQQALPGVSGRALAFALKDLIRAGLVERTVLEDYPPATLYRLTPRARLLRPILSRLAEVV